MFSRAGKRWLALYDSLSSLEEMALLSVTLVFRAAGLWLSNFFLGHSTL